MSKEKSSGKCQILDWLKEKAQRAGNFSSAGISRDAVEEEPESLGLLTDKLSDELHTAKGILTSSESQNPRKLCPRGAHSPTCPG